MDKLEVLHEQVGPLLARAAKISAENGINLVAAANVETNGMLATAILRDVVAAPVEMMIAITLLMDVTQGANKHQRMDFLQRMAGIVISSYRDDLLLAKMILRSGVDSEASREVVKRYQAALDAGAEDNAEVYADEAEQGMMVERLQQDLVKAMASLKKDTPESA